MKKTKSIQQNEKGQILVILAVAMVALIAFTALAVDGSLVYNDRREDQSTADSSALAGAGAAAQAVKDHKPSEFYCGSSLGADASTRAVLAAQLSAQEDGITLLANDPSTKNYVQVTCGQDQFRRYLDIKVMVTTTTQMNFAKLLSRDSITTTVESTARVYPQQVPAFGNAIASLSKSCGNLGGVVLGGNSTLKIKGGGIFTNSCLNANGGPEVSVTGGDVQWYSSYSPPSSGHISPGPVRTYVRLPDIPIEPPVCTNAAYVDAPSSGTLDPGNYNGIYVGSKKTLILNPGLYCLKGDLGGNANSIIKANGVTFYLIKGGVSFNGSAEIHLAAPNCPSTSCPGSGVTPAIRGILMYVDETNQADITLNGGVFNDYMGTIYAPTANVKINGNSDNDTFNTQIIANRVEITGKAKMFMDLESAVIYQIPSSVELLK